MLAVKLEADHGLAILEPDGALTKEDFERARAVIDPYLEKAGTLNGLIVHAREFPGWDSFGALSSHLSFVRDHHKRLKRLAVCTDSPLGGFAEKIASHFIGAEIRAFKYAELAAAKAWVAQGG